MSVSIFLLFYIYDKLWAKAAYLKARLIITGWYTKMYASNGKGNYNKSLCTFLFKVTE
jgi:hypothetical protein